MLMKNDSFIPLSHPQCLSSRNICCVVGLPILLLLTHCRGYKRFFKRTNLEGSEYVKDDCLILKCTVGVVKSRMERPKQYTVTVSPSDMGESFKQLLDNEMGCDIVFEVGDERFKAHKLILAARSPVFRAQFFGLIGNPNKDTVVVEDVEPSIFEVLVLYPCHCFQRIILVFSVFGYNLNPGQRFHLSSCQLFNVCIFNIFPLK